MLLFYVDFRLGAFSVVAYYKWGIFDGTNYFVNIVSWLISESRIAKMEQGTYSPIVSHSEKKYIFHTIKRTSILFHFMFLLVRQVGSSYYHFILFSFWPVRRETWLMYFFGQSRRPATVLNLFWALTPRQSRANIPHPKQQIPLRLVVPSGVVTLSQDSTMHARSVLFSSINPINSEFNIWDHDGVLVNLWKPVGFRQGWLKGIAG